MDYQTVPKNSQIVVDQMAETPTALIAMLTRNNGLDSDTGENSNDHSTEKVAASPEPDMLDDDIEDWLTRKLTAENAA